MSFFLVIRCNTSIAVPVNQANLLQAPCHCAAVSPFPTRENITVSESEGSQLIERTEASTTREAVTAASPFAEDVRSFTSVCCMLREHSPAYCRNLYRCCSTCGLPETSRNSDYRTSLPLSAVPAHLVRSVLATRVRVAEISIPAGYGAGRHVADRFAERAPSRPCERQLSGQRRRRRRLIGP